MDFTIDQSVLRYIPKKIQSRVAACDKWQRYKGGYTYNVIFDDDITSIMADSVDGLRWAAAQVAKGRTGLIYG